MVWLPRQDLVGAVQLLKQHDAGVAGEELLIVLDVVRIGRSQPPDCEYEDAHKPDPSRGQPMVLRYCLRAQASAAPIRSSVDGWVPKRNCSHPGGSGSSMFSS